MSAKGRERKRRHSQRQQRARQAGSVAYVPTRRERRKNPQGTKPHHGALRGGRPYFVTPERSQPKVSKWLRPNLRCH